MTGSYGKFMNSNLEKLVVFEYQPMLSQLLYEAATNASNTDFETWLTENPNILFQFADYLVYTLTSPRYSYYEANSYQVT